MKDATFDKGQLANIKRAKTLLRMANVRSRHDNRDTQILDGAIKCIDEVIEYNK